MISNQDLELFLTLFRSRDDIYARRWENKERSGYSPAYEFNWDEFNAHRAKGGNLKNFSNKKLLSLNRDVILSHLIGKQVIGIYPLLKDNTSYFIAADFDKDEWKVESRNLLNVCTKYDIPSYIELSRSGNGAHIWIFFEEKIEAYKSRKILFEFLKIALNKSEFEKEMSFDRLFPNQDYHTKSGFGNLIALPLNGISVRNGNSCFINPETFDAYPDQWNFLSKIKKVSSKKLNELYLSFNSDYTIKRQIINQKALLITIKSEIILQKAQLSPELIQFLRDNLKFINTEYIIKNKIGKSVYKTDKYFKTITESGENVKIPRGFMNALIKFCKENHFPFEINDARHKTKEIEFKSTIELLPFQKTAVESAKFTESGIIVAPPGSGKTVVGLQIIAEKKLSALIIVHRKQILNQWIERIQSYLGFSKSEIGIIASGKKKIGEKITVAMIQSLFKMSDISEISQVFGTIIIDECHHIPAKTFRYTIQHFDSYYIYGLTATPIRKYNDEKLIFVYIGDIIYELKKNNIAENIISNPKVEITIRETSLSLPFNYKTDDYQILSKIITFDTSRNLSIIEDVIEKVKNQKHVLILTERKEHVNVLNLYLKHKCEVIIISGEDSISSQKLKIEQIKAGHFNILISTGQFFGEGTDIKGFDCLFLVYPFSFEGKLLQYIGRIEREQTFKQIFDYRDIKIDFLEKQFLKRLRYYKKLAHLNNATIEGI